MAVAAVAASSPLAIDRLRALRTGAIGGVVFVFIATIGMAVAFDSRSYIDPVLSLGYTILFATFLITGYQSAYQPTIEGVSEPVRGPLNVVAGAASGIVCGLIAAVFLVLVDAFDTRDVFTNLSPDLVEMLVFDGSVGTGVVAWLLIGAGLGAAGGALFWIGERVRNTIVSALLWIAIVGFIELVVVQIVTELIPGNDLDDTLLDALYGSRRGLTVGAAVVVAVLTGWLAYRSHGRPGLRARFAALPEEQRRSRGLMLAAIFLVAGLLLPQVFGSFLNEILTIVGLFLLMGLGLNIVVGLAGLLDLGYVAFFAVGAYTTAILTSPQSPTFNPELTFFLAIPVVVVAAAIAGVIVGTPVIRMRGDYLAIVTLGFGEIARVLFLSDWFKPVFGAAQGITRIPSVEIGPITVRGTNPQQVFYLILIFVVLVAYVSWRLQDSRIGRAWIAMREDEQVAEAMGVNIVAAKLLAFVIGAIMASFAGALFAAKIGSIFPNSFQLLVSIIVLVVIIVGGMGNIPGVAVGSLVLLGVLGGPTSPGLLREFEEFKLLIYGTLLVYMMLKRPEGLLPSARRTRELHQDEFLQDAWVATQAAEGGATEPEEAG